MQCLWEAVSPYGIGLFVLNPAYQMVTPHQTPLLSGLCQYAALMSFGLGLRAVHDLHVQFPTRPSKAELRSAALDQPPEPSTSEASQRSGPDVMVVWSLPDSAGNPRCIGAHHIYDLQEQVC